MKKGKSQSVRLSGYYEIPINPFIEIDQHSLPYIEEVTSNLRFFFWFFFCGLDIQSA